jgi:outer membrane protein, multidrug efflux system
MKRSAHALYAAALAALLAGCATVSPEGQREQLVTLAGPRAGGSPLQASALAREPDAETTRAIDRLLARPLDAEAAVRIALLNNPGLQASLAALQISDADRAQAGRLPNPHLAFCRMVEGGAVEIERALRLDLLALLTLPWRLQWQERQHALAQLQAAQDVIRLAADTRKAWFNAVAAQQTAAYARDAREATEAAAELARRMVRAGNFSRYRQAKEQAQLADAAAQEARARQAAFSAREQLTRLMGLWGGHTAYTLPDRLPELPQAPANLSDVEARALRERLDVRAARDESRYVAESLGLTRATGFINALELSAGRNTHFDNTAGTRDTAKGWELELPLPIFDWGNARNARAEGIYLQSAARVREVAVRARSEAREAWQGYHTAWDLARHYRDEIVPLRKFLNEETLLRYNGMLLSVWDLLADTRQQALAVASAIEAQRDFWIADTDLQTALTGTSPGALATFRAAAAASPTDAGGN